MKLLKTKFIVFLLALLFSTLFLLFFKPILTADSLIFPYSVHFFDIANDYPKVWLCIKLIYCFNLFITIFLIFNSVSIHFKFNKTNVKNKCFKNNSISLQNANSFNLLVGTNSINNEEIYIPEKGLYQNILVTGTIGSREDQLCNVSASKSNN